MSAPQNFENHGKTPWPLIYVSIAGIVVVLVGLAGTAMLALDGNWAGALVGVCACAAALLAVGAGTVARFNALMLQDRLIRLEMRLRLARLLPPELQARIDELTVPQLIALRFASDEELPGLTEKVLEKQLTASAEIKKAVSNWQADHMRV